MVVGLHGVTVRGAEKSGNGVNVVFREEPEMGKGVWKIQRTVSLCDIKEQRAAKGGKLNQLVPAHCHKKCLT